jgi:hypothetical protein
MHYFLVIPPWDTVQPELPTTGPAERELLMAV